MRPRSAFTLIELLVVISIIAVLASMLMPAIGLVRDQARQTRCASSQRQVAMGIQAYGNDWEGMLPRIKTPQADDMTKPVMWLNAVAPYVGHDQTDSSAIYGQRGSSALWACPLWKANAATPSRIGIGMTWYPLASESWDTTFCWLDPSGGFNGIGVDIPFARASLQGRRILLGDSLDWHLFITPFLANPAVYYPGVWDPQRHRGRAVYGFFDGHVQAILSSGNAYLGCSNPASAAWNP